MNESSEIFLKLFDYRILHFDFFGHLGGCEVARRTVIDWQSIDLRGELISFGRRFQDAVRDRAPKAQQD